MTDRPAKSLANECAPSKCTNCPSKGNCSGATSNTAEFKKIADNICNAGQICFVLSGKGGVGKSTVSTQLAFFLSESMKKHTGLLDLDITGPSIPTMTATQEAEVTNMENGSWMPVSVTPNLKTISIGQMLPQQDSPVILRGPKIHGMINMLLSNVCWGFAERTAADNILIIDTPPGTSDCHLSGINLIQGAIRYMMSNNYPKIPQTYAVIVSTPQEVALVDVRKEVNFCAQADIRLKGVIENMCGYVCPHCSKKTFIFHPSTGGVQKLCDDFKLLYLGHIPIDPIIMQAGEEGMPWSMATNIDESVGYELFADICMKIIA